MELAHVLLRKKIQSLLTQNDSLWTFACVHSAAYVKILKLSESDLEILENIQKQPSAFRSDAEDLAIAGGFLDFSCEGESFSFRVVDVCGPHYGKEWTTFVMVFCLTNPTLNVSCGQGTTILNVLPDEWHDRICRHLRENAF